MRLAGTNFLPSVRSGGVCRTVEAWERGGGGRREHVVASFWDRVLGAALPRLPSVLQVCLPPASGWGSTIVSMEEKEESGLGGGGEGREAPGLGWLWACSWPLRTASSRKLTWMQSGLLSGSAGVTPGSALPPQFPVSLARHRATIYRTLLYARPWAKCLMYISSFNSLSTWGDSHDQNYPNFLRKWVLRGWIIA